MGIFQKSKFAASGADEAGKQNKFMLFCPELFQSRDTFSSPTSYKENVCWRSEMGDVFEWMLNRRDDNTIVAATDARSSKIRFELQTIVLTSQRDELKHLENHIMYKGTPS